MGKMIESPDEMILCDAITTNKLIGVIFVATKASCWQTFWPIGYDEAWNKHPLPTSLSPLPCSNFAIVKSVKEI